MFENTVIRYLVGAVILVLLLVQYRSLVFLRDEYRILTFLRRARQLNSLDYCDTQRIAAETFLSTQRVRAVCLRSSKIKPNPTNAETWRC